MTPPSHPGLHDFVRESNRIENIVRDPTPEEIEAHEQMLSLDVIRVADMETFVKQVAGKPLRERPGMDVRVGGHLPPPGGPAIRCDLEDLLGQTNDDIWTPYEAHCRYETLHPFLDGNGRSGRALWAWQMLRLGRDPFLLMFLRSFYYQALDGFRA